MFTALDDIIIRMVPAHPEPTILDLVRTAELQLARDVSDWLENGWELHHERTSYEFEHEYESAQDDVTVMIEQLTSVLSVVQDFLDHHAPRWQF